MKKVVYIPYWVHDTLTRKKLPLDVVLDFEQMKLLFSAHDQAGILALQRFTPQLYGRGVQDAQHEWLPFIWEDSASAANKEVVRGHTAELSYDESIGCDVFTRLFTADSRTDRHPTAFITYDMTPETVGVVVYPGHFIAERCGADLSCELVESLLRVFYAYEPHHVVAGTELFTLYLHLLQLKNVIV